MRVKNVEINLALESLRVTENATESYSDMTKKINVRVIFDINTKLSSRSCFYDHNSIL